MSEPDTDSDTDIEQSASAPRNGPKKVPRGKARLGRPDTAEGKSRWITVAALVIAVIAVAIAIAAWFRPAHSSAPKFSDQQTSEAKKNTCAAYNSVHQAVVINTHMANPRGDDPVGQLAVAANARLALLGGGEYLRDRLAANPATPSDLANAVTSMAKTIEDLGLGYMTGGSGITLDPLRSDLNTEIGQIDALCS